MALINRFVGVLLTFVMGQGVAADSKSHADTVMVTEINQILKDLTQHPKMGAREAGTEQERHTAAYIKQYFTDLDYQIKGQSFTFKAKGGTGTSENIITERTGLSGKVLVIGAHYDSAEAAKGSTGATDNGSGVAAMLLLAKHFAQIKPDITLRFIAYGAEEIGLKGSRYYVRKLSVSERKNIVGMINFDTIAGGDKLYIHSADKRPYQCDRGHYTDSSSLRDALLKVSTQVLAAGEQFMLHPETPEFAKGVTGSWSDHAPFACAGVPIAYFEATNFELMGKNGKDGYSQTQHAGLWTCFDQTIMGSCERDTEKQWGRIWHTRNDSLDKMEQWFPHRLSRQISRTIILMKAYINDLGQLQSKPE